jgi:transposase, IS5 family
MEEGRMAYRLIGQERLSFAAPSVSTSSLDDLSRPIDWDKIAGILGHVHASAKTEPAWPPLDMFKALAAFDLVRYIRREVGRSAR